jgi:ribonucleoside-diphosphate reductase alpha chain
MAQIADKIGGAVVNTSLVHGQPDVLDDENKGFVLSLTRQICNCINPRETSLPTQDHVNEVIEEVSARNNKSDMVHAFVAKCRFESENEKRFNESRKLKVVRRDGSVVLWNREKIKDAVELTFTANHQSPEWADQISRAMTETILREGLLFSDFKNVQDRAGEELMRQGEYEIAEAYILYRAKSAKLREFSDAEKEDEITLEQRSIIVIENADDGSFLWDGSELCKRMAFANAGVDSHVTFDEIFSSLREGISSEISISRSKKYFVSNAQRLIEKNPVWAVFAAE